ncbi:uncharacterized protein [Palaemon carinicauda]|uniref:uncharacterized protein n=1 Tax=Palaemon carinicauda TaxID=392227 RepID=UPI0035B61B44
MTQQTDLWASQIHPLATHSLSHKDSEIVATKETNEFERGWNHSLAFTSQGRYHIGHHNPFTEHGEVAPTKRTNEFERDLNPSLAITRPGRYHQATKNPIRCLIWTNLIQIQELTQKTSLQLNSSYRVCSRHFSTKNYQHPASDKLCQNACPDQHVKVNLVGTIPALENRSSEIKTSSLKHEFTADYLKDTGSEVYSNATVTSNVDNIGFADASFSPTTTIETAIPTYGTNTATITTPPPTAATTTTTTSGEVDCSILTGNDNYLQEPEMQYDTIQLGLNEEGEPAFTTLKSNESTSSLQRKKINQCALIKKQRMQICRLIKKLEQMKELTYLALGTLLVCIIFNFALTYKCMNISACLHT